MQRSRQYAARFNKLFDYIDRNLDKDLTVDELSAVVNFSKFHFQRQFSEYCGISIGRYIQLMRLKRASYRLAYNKLERVIDIALDSGFENPESFSRAFKAAFGQTPTGFRKAPAWQPWNGRFQFPDRERPQTMDVKIVTVPETKIAVLEHRGPAEGLNSSVGTFIEWRKSTGLSPVATSQTLGIAYDDPERTEPAKFRFDICGSVGRDVPPNPQGVITKTIPAGRCAVVRHLGPHSSIAQTIYPLYRDWLPQSGEELRDFPLYFHYLNLVFDTPECDLITDIYLPLR